MAVSTRTVRRRSLAGARARRRRRSSSDGGAGDGSLPWLGAAAIVVAVVLVWPRARRRPARSRSCRSPRSRVWCARLGRVVDRAGPELGVREPHARLPRLRARRRVPRRADARGSRSALRALLGAVCVWALAGKVAAVRSTRTTAASPGCASPSATGTRSRCSATSRCRSGSGSRARGARPATLLVYGWIVAIALTYSRGGVARRRRRRRAWIAALAARGSRRATTLVAAGLPAAVVLALAFSLAGRDERRPVARDARPRRAASSASPCSSARAVAAALARLPLPGVDAAAAPGRARGARRRDRRRRARGRRRARATRGGDRSRARSRPRSSNSTGRFVEVGVEPPLGLVAGGVARLRATTRSQGTGAGSFEFTNLRYRTTSLDSATEPHDLPLQFLTRDRASSAPCSSSAPR